MNPAKQPDIKALAAPLEKLYRKYNRREYVHPDPLEFLYNYPKTQDREIAGFIAASLAYGRVEQILKAARFALSQAGPSPKNFLAANRPERFREIFKNFKYRFTEGREMANLFAALKETIARHGSLENCFAGHSSGAHGTAQQALLGFIKELYSANPGIKTLVPSPDKKSAFKRINLYLRWMIRKDAVDPGGWTKTGPEKLIVPLDTHMHKISLELCCTARKQADLAAALEITDSFRKISPQDPVKYDFCLTRFGIRSELDLQKLKLCLF